MRFLRTVGLAAIGVTSACSSSSTPPSNMPPGGDRTGAAEVQKVQAIGSGLAAPFDAAPANDGATVYFTAVTDMGGGVFSVAAAGGTPTQLASGFLAPVQVVSSLDGMKVYVADAADTDGSSIGLISAVAVSGGDKTPLAQTKGYAARGLEVAKVDGKEWIYFVGTDPSDGQPGVFRTQDSGAVEAVKKGAPFVEPSAVAVTTTGDVFVSDPRASGSRGAVHKISGGNASLLIEDITLGNPAGVALSYDEKFLLVSAMDSSTGASLVYRIEIATGMSGTFDQGISQNHASAGLHRAHDKDLFAWADFGAPRLSPSIPGVAGSSSGSSGTVYLVCTKQEAKCQ
ncbi:MAG: hypothetical protein U1E65_06825 [Myxococcota bacterium]